MSRVKHGVASRARRKKVSKMAKGQRAGRSKWNRITKESVNKGLAYGTRDRRAKKREFRALWVLRISNKCKEFGISYSKFMRGLADGKVRLNRKMLAELAVYDSSAFKKLVDSVKKA